VIVVEAFFCAGIDDCLPFSEESVVPHTWASTEGGSFFDEDVLVPLPFLPPSRDESK